MNIDRIDTAIMVMERVRDQKRPFNIITWQDTLTVRTETEALDCGTACCFGGWLSISPEWIKTGGEVTDSGMPKYGIFLGSDAIGKWLGVTTTQAKYITSPASYLKEYQDVSPSDVISRLVELKNKGG